MKKIFCFSCLLIIALVFTACNSSTDKNRLEEEILQLHKDFITAHLSKDVDFFIDNMTDQYLSVNGGDIIYRSKNDMRERMSGYLNNTEFVEYSDISEPIIEVSDDGSMAWSVVQVKISGVRTMPDSTVRELDFTCAWINLYERKGDKWILKGDVSTFK